MPDGRRCPRFPQFVNNNRSTGEKHDATKQKSDGFGDQMAGLSSSTPGARSPVPTIMACT
jgi:hypothetical protein